MALLASLRSTIAYQTTGSTISTGAIYTTIGGIPTWSNQLTYSTLSGSTISTNTITSASTLTGSSIILGGNLTGINTYMSGTIGIGTASPYGIFDTRQSTYTCVNGNRYYSNNTFGFNYGTTGSYAGYAGGMILAGLTYGTSAFMSLAINQNSAVYEALTITQGVGSTSQPNVGIGTTSPTQLLEVYKNNGVGTVTQVNITSWAGANTTTNQSVLNLRVQGAGGGGVDNTIIGQYNGSGSGTYAISFNPNGVNVMNVLGNGYVGIGTTNPDVPLVVNGSIRCNSTGIIYLNAGGVTNGSDNSLLGRLYFVDSAGYAFPGASIEAYGMGTTGPGFGAELRFNVNAYSYGGTQTRLRVGLTGTIYLSAYNTNGTVITSGSNGTLSVSSDSRIKNSITYITDTTSALTQVNNLKPATFCMNGAPDIHLGFIAQDVEQHIPLAVDGKKHEYQWEVDADGKPLFNENGQIVYKVDSDGNKIIRPRGLSDRAIIATQTLAIQELSKQLASQQSQIDALIQRLTAANIA